MPTSAALRTEPAALCFSLLLSAAGCAGPPARAALQGDLGSLQAAVARAESQGQLGRSSVRELAGAVLERELSSLQEPLQELPELGPCARGVRGALVDVAEGSGEPAAFASLALLDAGLEAPRPNARQADDSALLPVTARRALGTRAGGQRRALLLHGDADVRRAALEAAERSRDPEDVPALLEAARLDPDARSRELALRALGGIGGPTVVVALADQWAAADPELRLHIVHAWQQPASFRAGGEQQLVRTAELGTGTVAVAAALALVREGGAATGLATTLLARALRGTDPAARLLALYEVPWSNRELQVLVVQAQSSEDAASRLISLLRQAEQGPLGGPARDALRSLAAHDSPAVALLARATLARIGDASVKAALLTDIQAPRARDRMLAAFALVQLGEWGAAARALADDSPFVRQTVACQMLAEPRSSSAAAALQQSRSEAFGPLAPELTGLLVPANQSGS